MNAPLDMLAMLAADPSLDPAFRQVLTEFAAPVLPPRLPTGCGPDALYDDPQLMREWRAAWIADDAILGEP